MADLAVVFSEGIRGFVVASIYCLSVASINNLLQSRKIIYWVVLQCSAQKGLQELLGAFKDQGH